MKIKFKNNKVQRKAFCVLIAVGCCIFSVRSFAALQDSSLGGNRSEKSELFSCKLKQENILSPELEQLYQFGLYIDAQDVTDDRINMKEQDLASYRIAAEYGHSRANVRLRHLLINGYVRGFSWEEMNHLKQLLKQHDQAEYLYLESLGAEQTGSIQTQTSHLALLYRAALQGQAEAQYLLASKILLDNRISLVEQNEISQKSLQCASENGHGSASLRLAEQLRAAEKYTEAIEMLQRSLAQGHLTAAMYLIHAFSAEPNPISHSTGNKNLMQSALSVIHIYWMCWQHINQILRV